MDVILLVSVSIQTHSRALHFDANSTYDVPKTNISSVRMLEDLYREANDTEKSRDMKIKE